MYPGTISGILFGSLLFSFTNLLLNLLAFDRPWPATGGKPGACPGVSILVPARNEADHIKEECGLDHRGASCNTLHQRASLRIDQEACSQAWYPDLSANQGNSFVNEQNEHPF